MSLRYRHGLSSGRRAGLTWYAVLLLAGLLAGSCATRIDDDGFRIIEPTDDPHSLAWTFDIKAREPVTSDGGHARVGRYRMVAECGDGSFATYVTADSWLESDSLSMLVMYGDRARSRAVAHYNVGTPRFDDDRALDYDQDGGCDVALIYRNHDTLLLEIFNHSAGSRLRKALLTGVDRDGNGYWDGRAEFVDDYDVNGDGCPELLIAVDVGYDLYPRQLMCVDPVHDTVLWTYGYAGIVSSRVSGVVPLVPDSTPAILLGISSKGNAAVAGEMDDRHSYVVLLGLDGRPRWQYETGGTFTRSDPVAVDYNRDGRLEIVAPQVIDSTIGDSTVVLTELHVLDGLSGELVHSLTMGAVGRVQDFRAVDLDQDGTSELMLGLSVGRVLMLDQQLNVIRRAKLPGRPSFVAARDILGDGKQQLLLTTSDNHLWLLDDDLTVLAQFYCHEQPLPAWCYVEPGGDAPWRVVLAADRGRVYYILDLRETPFSRVFSRYPALAFWVTFIPMALIVIMLWYMWSRLRRKNRLISEQRDELNRAVEKLRLAQAKLIAVEELQKAQSALTASEQRFRELADMMPQVLFELDREGRVTYSNRQAFVCFGYEPEDVGNGISNFDLIVEEDRERLMHNHRRALQGADYTQSEYTARRKDGTTFPAMTYTRPIVREGEVVGLRGILLDISEMKRAARTLRETERRYQALIEATDTGYLILDQKGHVVDANEEYVRLTGHANVEQILGRQVTEWTADHDRERHAIEVRKCLEHGSTRNLEIDYIWPDGRVVPIEINAEVVTTADGTRILSLCRDITERRQADEALRMSEERYRGLVEGAGEAIFLIDRQGVYQYMNQIAAERLGGSPENFLGRNAMDLFPREVAEGQLEMAQRVFDSGDRSVIESITELQGERRCYRTSLQPILGADGSVVSVLGIARDITSFVEAQRELNRERDFVATLLATTHSLIVCLDQEGRITVFNNECERLTGYRREEVMGKVYIDLFLPDDHPSRLRADRDFSAWAEDNVSVSFEAPLVTKAGEVRTILWSNSSQHDARADGWSSISVGQDVTDRKRAEDEIRKFATIAEQAHYGNAIVDLEGKILFVNDHFARLHGYEVDELLGRNLAVFHNDEQMPRVNELNSRVKEVGSYENEEVWHLHRDGSVFPTIMNGMVIADEHGVPSYLAATAVDISERKRAETALAESEEKYRQLVENIEADILVIDYDGTFLFVNERSTEFFGISAVGMVGKKNADFFSPEETARQLENIRRVIDTGMELTDEAEIVINEEKLWFSVTILPYFHAPSQAPAALLISRDITDSRQAARALRESEEKWRDLMMNLPDNIMSVDREGTILAINWTMPGWTPDQVVGLKATDCIAEDYRAPFSAALEEVFVTGQPGRMELLADGPNGPYSAFYITRIVRSSVNPNRATLISTDITERRDAQDALRQSEERIRTLLNATTETMVLLDTKGRILALNHTAAQRMGYAGDDIDSLIGQSAIDLVTAHWSEEIRDVRVQRFRESLRTGKATRSVDERDGMIFDTHCYPFQGDNGEVSCLAFFATDITEAREAEEELRRAAEERYEQVRRIAGGVAHEIYNALFPAVTSLAKLSERLDLEAPEELVRNRALLSLASRSVTRAVDTTDLVKVFTRLEEERATEHVSLRSIIDEVRAAHAERVKSLGVDVVVDVPPDDFVTMSDRHAYSVFNNLMANSLDALADVDRERRIAISSRRENGWLRVEFADNGPGIPEDDLPRIFQAFFSTKPTTGTGLGLVMVRRIIELYGGKIRANSTIDKITAFIILFRMAPERRAIQD